MSKSKRPSKIVLPDFLKKLKQIPQYTITMVVLVTPEMAKEWLERNKVNRRLSHRQVTWIAEQIRKGRWELIGDKILFDWHGNLIDGQHRLLAVTISGSSVEMEVGYGYDPLVRQLKDRGRKRQLSNDLKTDYGLTNTGTRQYYMNMAIELIAGTPIVVRDIHDHADWRKVIPGHEWAVETFSKAHPYSQASIGGALAFAYKTDPEAVQIFGTQVIDGVGLKKGDPALTFRNWFVRYQNTAEKYNPGGGTQRKEVYALRVLRCLRAAMEGQEVHKIIPRSNNEDILFFRMAYKTPSVKKLVSPWIAGRARELQALTDDYGSKKPKKKKKKVPSKKKPRVRAGVDTPPLRDLTGLRSGKLVVESFAGRQQATNKRWFCYWNCLCDCGRRAKVVSHQLTGNQSTQSCGCGSREAGIAKNSFFPPLFPAQLN